MLEKIVDQLLEMDKGHVLSGNWKEYKECHIEPEWLLVYKIYADRLILLLSKTGTHSDLNFFIKEISKNTPTSKRSESGE